MLEFFKKLESKLNKTNKSKTMQVLDERSANFVSNIFDFIEYRLGLAYFYLNNEKAKYIFEQDQKCFRESIEQIPSDKRIEPNPRIALNAANEYRYCLNEESIRKMFLNLIVSDMNKDKKYNVHPSFTDIIKSLSTEDAKFLKELNEHSTPSYAVDFIGYKNPRNNDIVFLKKVLIFNNNETMSLNGFVINNLERLNLIKLTENKSIAGCLAYGKGFESVKDNYEETNILGCKLTYIKGTLEKTDLGKRFINVCLS